MQVDVSRGPIILLSSPEPGPPVLEPGPPVPEPGPPIPEPGLPIPEPGPPVPDLSRLRSISVGYLLTQEHTQVIKPIQDKCVFLHFRIACYLMIILKLNVADPVFLVAADLNPLLTKML